MTLFARVDHVADTLARSFTVPIERALKSVVDGLGPPRDAGGYGPFDNIWVLALARFVSRYALDIPNLALPVLAELTSRFTAEFEVRPFLERYPEITYNLLLDWTQHPNVHVRRLVSEGTRPRLPWAAHLTKYRRDPRPLFPLLERLKDDEEVYVRKSVANNVADVLKDNPSLGYALLRAWSCDAPERRRWVVRHAIRLPLSRDIAEARELASTCQKIDR
jgi:3-methyladenine DNA glycosylase AlkC